jgi:hypothetical protein
MSDRPEAENTAYGSSQEADTTSSSARSIFETNVTAAVPPISSAILGEMARRASERADALSADALRLKTMESYMQDLEAQLAIVSAL